MGSQLQLVPARAGKAAQRGLSLPLPLFLSERLPAEAVTRLRELIFKQPHLARLVEKEEADTVHVLDNFEDEELVGLANRRQQAIGLPCVERFLACPQVLSAVQSLPVFDLILLPNTSICCSGLSAAQRIRCFNLVHWMGSRTSQELAPDTGLLVANRVSLRPDSKYQAALARGIRVVSMEYLEAAWTDRALPQSTSHELLGLQGLSICLDPLDQDLVDECQALVKANGAVLEAFSRAEVVITRDIMTSLYQKARAGGILVASPKWLRHCCEQRRCVMISGEFAVTAPVSSPLAMTSSSVTGAGQASCSTLAVASSGVSRTTLLGCVLCLLYLPAELRPAAQALAWSCGAYTTLDPGDAAITHVLFRYVPQTTVSVSVRVIEDQTSFIDLSWLEVCARQGVWAKETDFPHQNVMYNPATDLAVASGKLYRRPSDPQEGRSASAASTAPAAPLPLPPIGRSQQSQARKQELPDQNFSQARSRQGGLPLPGMESCAVRITALPSTRDSQSTRARLEELARQLGAQVMTQGSKLSKITHWVCVFPEVLDPKSHEYARQRKQHVVTQDWLLDSHRQLVRRPEHLYDIGPGRSIGVAEAELPSLASAASHVAGVLTGHLLLISMQALGSNKKLVEIAEELGGAAKPWQTWQELRDALACLPSPSASSNGSSKKETEAQVPAGAQSTAGGGSIESKKPVVLLEAEEARHTEKALQEVLGSLPGLGGFCVLFTWLVEAHSQWRLLPEDAFRPSLPMRNENGSGDGPPAKRARLEEASVAWQTEASQKLEELTAEAQERERQTKAQQKVTEGLRVAEMRQEQSRLGG